MDHNFHQDNSFARARLLMHFHPVGCLLNVPWKLFFTERIAHMLPAHITLVDNFTCFIAIRKKLRWTPSICSAKIHLYFVSNDQLPSSNSPAPAKFPTQFAEGFSSRFLKALFSIEQLEVIFICLIICSNISSDDNLRKF